MASSPATSYVRTMFATTDHVAILAVPRRSETGVVQEVLRAGTLAHPDTQRRLQNLNQEGYDVYCTVNAVKPNARSRTKADIADVRRLQLDLDDNGRQGLAKLRADVDAGRVPSPAVVMQSSKGSGLLDRELRKANKVAGATNTGGKPLQRCSPSVFTKRRRLSEHAKVARNVLTTTRKRVSFGPV